MFREIATQRTHSQGYRRRWFQSDKMDLYTWHTDSGAILGFQLAYDRLTTQRAITWISGKGYFHARVDEGEPSFVSPTPFLVPEAGFDAYRVHAEFIAQAAEIDKDIALLVSRKLRDYLAASRGGARIKAAPVLLMATVAACVLGLLLRRLLK